MQIRSLVGESAQVCGPETSLQQAAAAMIRESTGSLGVVDDGKLAGIITERDVLRAAAEGVEPGVATVADWMTSEPDTVGPDIPVDEVAEWMLAAGYRHLPVMEEGKLLGVTSIKDVLWALHSISTAPPPPDQLV